jgi:hypothetical protein
MTKENVIYRMNLCTKCLSGVLEEYYEIDLKIAGCMLQQKKTTIICPGWEDSTHGKYLLPMSLGDLKVSTMKSE